MLIQGNAFHLPHPDKLFHCMITSPPYFGLRKYSGEQGQIYGGDLLCDHEWGNEHIIIPNTQSDFTTSGLKRDGRPESARVSTNLQSQQRKKDQQEPAHSMTCQKCGAWFGALGLEPTPELHIRNMVIVFREVWRVLRDDGVAWLNYGDCYTGGGRGQAHQQGPLQRGSRGTSNLDRGYRGIKSGNLLMMPHRLAIALQDDGWIIRNDLVWAKTNPMPESVGGWRYEQEGCDCNKAEREAAIAEAMEEQGTSRHRLKNLMGYSWPHKPDCPKCHGTGKQGDPKLTRGSWRHTRGHEYIFQLVKDNGYYCDQEVIREAISQSSIDRVNQVTFHEQTGGEKDYAHGINRNRSARGILENWERSRGGKNPRSVLTVPTAPYKGAHYATFPPRLIAPLIRASVPRRACPECDTAWAPVIERRESSVDADMDADRVKEDPTQGRRRAPEPGEPGAFASTRVIDYKPTCDCGREDYHSGIVLDIFGGSGTTGMVAKELMLRWVVIDISYPYLDQQAKIRTRSGSPTGALADLPLFERSDE